MSRCQDTIEQVPWAKGPEPEEASASAGPVPKRAGPPVVSAIRPVSAWAGDRVSDGEPVEAGPDRAPAEGRGAEDRPNRTRLSVVRIACAIRAGWKQVTRITGGGTLFEKGSLENMRTRTVERRCRICQDLTEQGPGEADP